jgi:hypothetical protein
VVLFSSFFLSSAPPPPVALIRLPSSLLIIGPEGTSPLMLSLSCICVQEVCCHVYKWRPQTPGVQLVLFADDTGIYATDRKESYVLRKLQRGLTAMEAWCETQAIYFSHRGGPVETHLTMKGRNIPFVKNVEHLGVILHREITWRIHVDSIATEAIRKFVRIYPLLKSERLSVISELTLYKASITSVMT